MIADTNGKRTHTFYRLTTSPRVRIGSPAAPSHKLRWNRDCLGLQSSKTGTIPPQLIKEAQQRDHMNPAPESVSRFGASERDELSARGLNRKLHPGLAPYSGMHFPPRASNGNCSPQFGRKVGCSFPGLAKGLRRLAYSPSRAFSGVIGSERTWWPVACATAEATAASGVLMTTSPIDLAPNGPVGS